MAAEWKKNFRSDKRNLSLRDVQESDSGCILLSSDEENSILSQPAELWVVAPPHILAQPSETKQQFSEPA